jgi:hypothetical protein
MMALRPAAGDLLQVTCCSLIPPCRWQQHYNLLAVLAGKQATKLESPGPLMQGCARKQHCHDPLIGDAQSALPTYGTL